MHHYQPLASDNRIRSYRLRVGFSQKQAALIMGYRDQSRLCHWETGRKVPTLVNALKLSATLKCPVEVLFSRLFDRIRADIFARKKSLGLWERYE
jgi:DNA-binding XRE family transcriptional regulator